MRFCGVGFGGDGRRLGSIARVALPVVALAIAIAQPVDQFREQDKSGSVEIHEFLKAILDSAPPGALLLERATTCFMASATCRSWSGIGPTSACWIRWCSGIPGISVSARKYSPT